MSRTATPFHAIADPTRRAILDLLRGGERSVSDLMRPLPGVSQSALSQHLAVLRRARLVTRRKDGRRRLYRVQPAPLAQVAEWVRHFEQFWDSRFDRLGAYLDREHPR